jgi:uncharacterized protein YidB (DUF937 family)
LIQEKTMGLLDQITGALGGASSGGGGGGGGQPDMMQIVMTLIQQAGGIEGLMAKLQQGGLADAASSWVGNGQNAPVSGQQLEGALGSDLLGSLAKQAGMGQGDLAGSLSQMLPQLIDSMSPNGQMPSGGGMPDLGGLLGSLLKR